MSISETIRGGYGATTGLMTMPRNKLVEESRADLLVRRGFYWVLPSGALGKPSDTFVRFCNRDRSEFSSPRA